MILRYVRLCVRLVRLASGAKLHSSAAFHPQTDRPSERSGYAMKTMNGFVERL